MADETSLKKASDCVIEEKADVQLQTKLGKLAVEWFTFDSHLFFPKYEEFGHFSFSVVLEKTAKKCTKSWVSVGES